MGPLPTAMWGCSGASPCPCPFGEAVEVVDCGVSTIGPHGGVPCDQSHITEGSPAVGEADSTSPFGVSGASVYVNGVGDQTRSPEGDQTWLGVGVAWRGDP